jgi:hypothetical protein
MEELDAISDSLTASITLAFDIDAALGLLPSIALSSGRVCSS